MTEGDRAELRWLLRRAGLLHVVILCLGGVIVVPSFVLPRAVLVTHAGLLAAGIPIVLVSAYVLVLRKIGLPGSVVGVVLFVGVLTISVVALTLLCDGASRIQYSFRMAVFGIFTANGIRGLVKAWRSGWRPRRPTTSSEAEAVSGRGGA